MRLRIVACLFLVVVVPPITGQPPNQPNNPISISTAKPLDVRADISKDWLDKIAWASSIALVFIGGFGVWYARRTLRAIQGQLAEIRAAGKQTDQMIHHANTQSEAAQQQVRISELAMIANNRAYVHHAGIAYTSHLQKGGPSDGKYMWRLRPTWTNTGNTPTRKLRVYAGYEFRTSPLPEDFSFTVKGPLILTLLASKGKIESTHCDIFGEPLADVRDGKKYLYVWGVARYFDVYPHTPEHVTKFCSVAIAVTGDPLLGYDPSANPVEIRFETYQKHNCADEDCDQPN